MRPEPDDNKNTAERRVTRFNKHKRYLWRRNKKKDRKLASGETPQGAEGGPKEWGVREREK